MKHKRRKSAQWLILALVALNACAGAEALRRADEVRATGNRDSAAQAYAAALRGEKMTPGERDHAREAIRELTAEIVTKDAANWVAGSAPMQIAEPLARLRGRVDLLERPDVSAAFAEIVGNYFQKHWPTVDSLRKAHLYVPAVLMASALTTPLTTDDPRRSKARELSEEAQAWHLARAKQAAGEPAALELHLGLASRFGADVQAPLAQATKAANTLAALGWTVGSQAADCASEWKAVAAELDAHGGVKVRAEFRDLRCRPDSQEETREEDYTYQVAYQVEVDKQVQDGYETYSEWGERPEQVCSSTYAGSYANGSPRYEGKCSTETRRYETIKTRPRMRWVKELVTKYRDERGRRVVHYVTHTFAFSGVLDVQSAGYGKAIPFEFSRAITDTWFRSEHGNKDVAATHKPETVRQTVIELTRDALRDRVTAEIAPIEVARHVANARTSAGNPIAAANEWALALRYAPSQPDANAWLAATFGFNADLVPEVLAGSRPTTDAQRAAAAAKADLVDQGRAYTKSDAFEFGLERGYSDDTVRMALEHARFWDVPYEPNRNATQFYMGGQVSLLSRLVENGHGLGFVDRARWGLVLGGTTTPTFQYKHSEEKETAMSWGLDAGYALLLGGRWRYLGLFVGLDASYRYRHVGDVAGARASVQPSARLELRFNDRHPIILSGWVGDLLRTMTAGYGCELVYPIGGAHGFVVSWDRESFDTRMGGIDRKDIVNVGARPAEVIGVGYQVGF